MKINYSETKARGGQGGAKLLIAFPLVAIILMATFSIAFAQTPSTTPTPQPTPTGTTVPCPSTTPLSTPLSLDYLNQCSVCVFKSPTATSALSVKTLDIYQLTRTGTIGPTQSPTVTLTPTPIPVTPVPQYTSTLAGWYKPNWYTGSTDSGIPLNGTYGIRSQYVNAWIYNGGISTNWYQQVDIHLAGTRTAPGYDETPYGNAKIYMGVSNRGNSAFTINGVNIPAHTDVNIDLVIIPFNSTYEYKLDTQFLILGVPDSWQQLSITIYYPGNGTWTDSSTWSFTRGGAPMPTFTPQYTSTPIPTLTPTPVIGACSAWGYQDSTQLVGYSGVTVSQGDCAVIIPQFSIHLPAVGTVIPAIDWDGIGVSICPKWVNLGTFSVGTLTLPTDILMLPAVIFIMWLIFSL